MKNNKILRIFTLLMVLVLCVGVFAGCKDEKTTSENMGTVSEDDEYFIYDPTGGDSASDENSNNSGDGNSTNTSDTSKQPNVSDKNPSTSDKNSNTSDDRLAVFKNMPSKLKGTTVSFANWGDESGDRYRKLAQKFTDDYGIKIKWVTYAQNGYASEILTQIAADNAPDIVISNGDFAAVSEITQPLPSYFDLNDGFWDKRMSEALKIKDKYYFVNTYNSPFTEMTYIFYNKQIFSSKGITTPEEYYAAGKWSIENFEKCMENVSKAGYTGALIEYPLDLARRIGGRDIFTYDAATASFKADITNNAVVQAVQLVADWRSKGIAVDNGNFTTGQIGMCIGTPWMMKFNGRLKDMSPSDIGVVPLPTSYKGKSLENNYVAGARGYRIAKGAKNPEGAYYFLRYYLDYENYQAAGISVFSNKTLEKYFMEKMVSGYKKNETLSVSYTYDCTRVIDNIFYPYNDPWKAAFQATSGQAVTELSKLQGICDNAAKTASEKLKKK